jgi:hypothetical protein
MRNRTLRIIALALCLCLGAGCASRSKKAQTPVHRIVGTVVSLDPSGRFVLIDAGTSAVVTSGQALKTFSNGQETGVLAVSPERKPPFVIADIVKGSPQKGDQVFE